MYEDAEYAEVPAIIYEPIRHHLLAEKNKKYIKPIKKELEIDQQLGLRNQAVIDQQSALEKDIDELTNSKDYYEITAKQLEMLFGLGKIKAKVAMINTKELIKGSIKSISLSPLLASICFVILAVLSIIWATKAPWGGRSSLLGV